MDLIIIDGNSLANRAFYAMPPLKNKNGLVCNAIFGFCNILVKLITENKPAHIAVAFDSHAPTFRHAKYAEYKAGRNAMPEDLITQMPLLQDLLQLMGIKVLKKDGIEADDILGTLSKRFDVDTVIVSGDKDLLQLIDDSTTVWLTKKGISEIEIFDRQHFVDVYGFEPAKIVDLKAMMGDSSDNIPGIASVGEKTALDFMHNFGSLDGLYANIDEIKGAKHDKVLECKDVAYLSYDLATIDVESDIDCELSETTYPYPFSQEVKNKFAEYGFSSLLKRNIFEENSTDDYSLYATNLFYQSGDNASCFASTHQDKECTIQEIQNLDELEKIISENPTPDVFSCHYEKYYDAFHFAFNVKNDYFFYFEKQKDTAISYIQKLMPYIKNENVDKVFYQYKKQKHFFQSIGLDINMPCFDLALAHYLVDASVRFDIIDKAFDYLGLDIKSIATGLIYARNLIAPQLKEMELQNLYEDIELKLEDVLFSMEVEGIKVDRAKLVELSLNFSKQIDEIAEAIYETAGETFNINSTKQLADILFDKLQIPIPKGKKRSTNIEMLHEIEHLHPIVPLLMRYRKVAKIVSTYLDGLIPHLDENDIVHTEFNQTMATTGRLSSINPNLQNIPTRDEEGKSLRKMFVCKKANNVFISADYSQIELRLLAHFSNDKKLVEAFKTGHDIHAYTASEIFNVDINLVTDDMRRIAKTVNFGIIYGISDYGLAQSLNLSRNEAKNFIQSYFDRYDGVKEYMANIIENARQTGYVMTMFGRKRYIPELHSHNKNIQKFGERIAMNTPLQGTESDIIKIAMIKVYDELKKQNLKSKLILQIHDELMVEAPENEVDKVSEILKDIMENVVELNIPLTVNISTGKTWYDV